MPRSHPVPKLAPLIEEARRGRKHFVPRNRIGDLQKLYNLQIYLHPLMALQAERPTPLFDGKMQMSPNELLLFTLAHPKSDFSFERVKAALKRRTRMSHTERASHILRQHKKAIELTQVWTSSSAQSSLGIESGIADFLPDLHAAKTPAQLNTLLQDMIDSDRKFLESSCAEYRKTVNPALEPATGRLQIEWALMDWQAARRAPATARLATVRLLKDVQTLRDHERRALFRDYDATHHLKAIGGKLMTAKAAKILTACIVGADRQLSGKAPFRANDRVMRAVLHVLEPRVSIAAQRRQTKRGENRRYK